MAIEWSDAWAVVSDAATFAVKFNAAVPGAYRTITTEDIRDLSHCGLIGRHGYYSRADIETVRGLLQYEKVRQSRCNVADDKMYVQTAVHNAESISDSLKCKAGV